MNEPECMVGGVIYNGVKVGFSNLDFTGSGYKKYMIGACDHLWSAKCFQYGLVGYSLHYRFEMVGAWGST